MTSKYYKTIKNFYQYLKDNNIELQSCGCCDGIVVDGEGGWESDREYIITVNNDEIKQWLKEHSEDINDH